MTKKIFHIFFSQKKTFFHKKNCFHQITFKLHWAALEVLLLVRWSVCRSVMFVKKWHLEYQKVIKTYLHTYLRDSSYSSDSSDSSDGNESSDQTTLDSKKIKLPKTYLPTYLHTNHAISQQKITQPLWKKNHATSLKKYHATSGKINPATWLSEWVRKVTQTLYTQKSCNLSSHKASQQNIARIAKRSSENITSVVKCV